MTAPVLAEAAPAPDAWLRPDARTVLVHCGWLLPPLGSTVLTALATGGRFPPGALITLASLAVSFAAITGIGLLRWSRTRYRVTGDAFVLRGGVFSRTLRTVPLSRVRGVDLTATPLHRLLGLTVLRASGTGGAETVLNAVTRAEAERLRALLLARADGVRTGSPELSRVDWRWLRYAPLTFWVIGGVGVAAGTVYRVLDGIGIELWRVGFVRDAFTEFGRSALWLTVPAALVAVLALGAVGALVLYVENWWGYRAAWTDANTLTVRRGLLTTRSVAVERSRLHGVLLREPLLLRAAGGASATAVAGGLGSSEEAHARGALIPPAPRPEALRVAVGALTGAGASAGTGTGASVGTRTGVSPGTGTGDRGEHPFTGVPLTPHPRVALRRRVVRGLLFAVLPGSVVLLVPGVLFSPVLLHLAWVYALVSTAVTLLLARDAYRSLGHALAGPHLLVRSGTFSRDTLALEREAISAWTLTTSPFTRRAGLVTLTAAVAAGEHGYHVRDMAPGDALALASAARPGILEEFLEPA
ncbi:PH domain-containing protein [Streptomyces sp. NPDC087440]|uniref:PH domain-containing protein n=1 Tax=Streptomyces sp. NPDC087440 TaxID=3365790 RepID=UPI003822227D